MTEDQTLENRLKEISVAPRVTLDDVMNNIAEEHFFTAAEGILGSKSAEPFHKSLSIFTICVLVAKNGFIVTGMSACASPDNYNKEIGEQIAKRNAITDLWGHMGFELRSKLAAQESTSPKDRVYTEMQEVSVRYANLFKFMNSGTFLDLSKEQRELMAQQANAMLDYIKTLQARLKAW